MARYRAILIMSVIALLLYAANWFLLSLPQFEADYSNYHYHNNLAALFGFFWICAALVLFAVHKVHAKTPDNTGYVYMGATVIQMGLSYLMLRPILSEGDNQFEKINFFAIFILFLAIETIITIRLLNNKQ